MDNMDIIKITKTFENLVTNAMKNGSDIAQALNDSASVIEDMYGEEAAKFLDEYYTGG